MEGYVLSREVQKKAKKYGMADERYLIYADLRACGWTVDNAWNVAFNGEGATWSNAMLEREKKKLESLESVQKRIEEIMGMRTEDKEELTPEELARATSKEKILTDLVLTQSRQKKGTKEWQETTKMIAEYSRIKQDDIQTEDTTIHYHLPVNYPNRCSDCLLFKSGKAEILKNKPKS